MSEMISILVVDDDVHMSKTLVDILNVKGYEAEAANSGMQALEKVNANDYDCVLTDIRMPGMNGVDLYEAIKNIKPDLPVVLMTAYAVDKLVNRGIEEGAIATLNKPLDIDLLLSFLTILRKECSVVIVDDDIQFSKTLGDILRNRKFAISQITDSKEVMENLREERQIVLLDMKLKDTSGLKVLKEIRKKYPYLPVVMVTGYRIEMTSSIEAAMEIDAYTYLYKPFEIEKLIEILSELRRDELSRLLKKPFKKRR